VLAVAASLAKVEIAAEPSGLVATGIARVVDLAARSAAARATGELAELAGALALEATVVVSAWAVRATAGK